ncbi:MAG TPA: helix-turn-helix domain-containing protein [Anaerolineaceae bacterium]
MEEYDIQMLVEKSGVSRRTIYFYIQQGILPAPQGAGLAARYTEEHLTRLRLIPVLRQQGLRLDQIRQRFEQAQAGELKEIAEKQSCPPTPQLQKMIPPYPAGRVYLHYELPFGMQLLVPQDLKPDRKIRVDQLLKSIHNLLS